MNKKNSPDFFIYTALECEAKTLIRQFALKKDTAVHPFSIYRNEEMVLTVTGMGKVAMAAGVAYSQAMFGSVSLPIMLNIGIAGHKTLKLGELIIASKVIDTESGRVFYPQLIGHDWPQSATLRTTTLANTTYSAEGLNDMEASAFYETAVKFSSCELIHCLKLVSDNENSAVDNITPKLAEQWVAEHDGLFAELVPRLQAFRASVIPVEIKEYEQILENWHFSVTGQLKLQSLLRRWNVLTGLNWLPQQGAEFATGKQVLRCIEQDIEKLTIKL